jgi:tRNA(Arg) A34 adenosine deaminase TadA
LAWQRAAFDWCSLFDGNGNLLGRGHNRRVQEDDPSIHGETDAFRKAADNAAIATP